MRIITYILNIKRYIDSILIEKVYTLLSSRYQNQHEKEKL